MCRVQAMLNGAAGAAILLAVCGWTQPPETPAAGPATATALTAQTPPGPEDVGDALMARRRYQAALEAYKQLAKPSAAVWNKMGVAYQMLLDQDDALRCYQASLRLDAKNASVLNNLGTIYSSQKEYGKAVKLYRRSLKINPHAALVLKNLGTDLMAQRKYEKGWEAYKQALEADAQVFDRDGGPRVENATSVQQRGAMNYYMAKGCVRAGRNERAIAYLRSALNEGYTSPQKVAADNEFAALRGLPEFERLIAPPEPTQKQ